MGEPLPLADRHAELIRASAISDEVRDARGYWTAVAKHELRDLGFSERQRRVPALVVPVHSVTGEVVLHQARPDNPRSSNDGKPVKYETPAKAGMALDVPPTVRHLLGNPTVPLFITEGVRKADSAASTGLCCMALLGVWNWRGTNDAGGKTAMADFELIALSNRNIYVAFDSDVVSKPPVHEAMRRLKAFLESRGATVHIVYLPAGEHGAKVGLDDYLAAGHTKDVLLALATTELRKPARPATRTGVEWQSGPYAMTAAGIVYAKPTREGTVDLPLTNFAARISSQVTEDDGAERRLVFEMQAQLKKQTYTFDVAAAQFASLNWVTEHLGAEAIVWPGQTNKDHARVAIQLLSGEVPGRYVYAHTGWRQVGGQPVYLHAGGALGPLGPVACAETRLEGGLAGYLLPAPPDGDELRRAVVASLALVEVAPERVTVPLLAMVYRAPLGAVDLSGFLVGPTHAGKSELAALAQQHYGAEMDRLHLPANWTSTSNSLEGTAFQVKDGLLVVDDFAPSGSSADVQRLHREADRLLRAQGNFSARQRMRADTTLRPAKPPRGLILGTGEDVPRGQSLRARLVVLEVGPDDVDWTRITLLQRQAAEGLLAASMAGFLRWLAPNQGREVERVRIRFQELRRAAVGEEAHRRTPSNIANLAIGYERFLEFAEHVGAIDADQRHQLWEQGWRALGETGEAQAEHLRSAEPTLRFLDLLRAAIASGEAHLADPEGVQPQGPESWGWRLRIVGTGIDGDSRWEPQGRRIGWVTGDNVYLEPEAAFAVCQRLGQASGDPLAIGQRVLEKRLHERGHLATIEESQGRFRIRVSSLEGRRRRVLHILVTSLFPEAGQAGQPGLDRATSEAPEFGQAGPGPENWPGTDGHSRQTGPANRASSADSKFGTDGPGPLGPLGPLLGDKTLPAPNGKGADQVVHERQIHAGAAVEWWIRPDGSPVCGVCHPRPGGPSAAVFPTCGGPVTGPLTGGWWCGACKDYVRPVASQGGGQ